jgi:hypothetical protein
MRGALGVAAVTSAAALATGCGAATAEDDMVARAVEATTATSARVSAEGVYDLGEVRQEFTGEGVYDWSRKNGRFETRYVLGEADEGPSRVEAVITPDAAYMAFPFIVRYGKRWLEVPVAGADEGPLSWFGGFGLAPGDPAAMLRFLRESSDKVEFVDRELVRGVETTHYRADLDWDRLARGGEAGYEEALIEHLKAESDGEPLTVDLWVDHDFLARRVRTAFPPIGTPLQLTIEFYDFGVPVEEERPPAGDVMTSEEFQKRAREECQDDAAFDEDGVSVCLELHTFAENEGGEDE